LNTRTDSWIAASELTRIRLDQFVLGRLPDESRSQVQNWIRKGFVRVNGAEVKTGYLVKPGDRIDLILPAPESAEPFPESIPIDVLYEDSDLAVINKPAGMVCHSGAGVRSGTLVNALLHRLGPMDTGDPARPGIVHRLDKFTSGVLLVAKNIPAHRHLSQQFKNRDVRKEYLAMVCGIPSPAVGTIALPLGRDPKDRKKISTRARRKRSAITHYRVREICGTLSLLDIRIETGRTHQIRVHLAQNGHPIVGDMLYGPSRMGNCPIDIAKAVRELGRPFLHSHRIEFRHPRSGHSLAFESPLPPELQRFLEAARRPGEPRGPA
jgi:23S rRNA pseudouridine1911/1915/1917 synthase